MELGSRLGDWNLKEDAMTVYAPSPSLQRTQEVAEGVIVGGTRNSAKKWSWPNSNSTWFGWCPSTEPTNYDDEKCLLFMISWPSELINSVNF